MRLKSYFANTVEAAMALAARQLGEDALLVYSREASAETRYLGAFEVVFAEGPAEAAGEPQLEQPAPVAAPAERAGDTERLDWAASALAELRNEIGFLRQDVASHRRCMEDLVAATDRRAWRLLADWGSEPELLPGVALAGRLLQTDMDPEHVLDVIESARDSVRASERAASSQGPGAEKWRRFLERELCERRPCDSSLGLAAVAGQSIVLIGPPGCGKTTVAMQLTALATSRGLDPKLIAFEPGRLTAAQTLRSFAAVLGAPFDLVRRGEHLANLVASSGANSITIVDGPGLGPCADTDEGAFQLTAFQSLGRRAETWLVLPAMLRACDLRLLIDRFSAYGISRLIFTRTGEARHWGAVWSAAEWAGLPIGFFCDGPRVPEDFKAACAQAIVDRLLSGSVPGLDEQPVRPFAGQRVAGEGPA